MPNSPIAPYSGPGLAGLVANLLGANAGISVVAGSIKLTASAADAVDLYDGSLAPLGIGPGLLLTSGTTPGLQNTVGWFGQDNTGYAADGTPLHFQNGDPDIDKVVNTVFQTQSYDATTLSFDFTVTDPNATSISFDLVFGTDEYPEWVDQFVDCAVVIVNGVNYALFNHDPKAPLSVISPNIAAGYFQDNAAGLLPIEYDGVSRVLKIVAPIVPGQVNSIKIGIADTGDHIYDSGLFIANLAAGNTPGSGVVITPDQPCTDGSDTVTGTVKDELIQALGGDDNVYAGGGDDIVVAGAGNDHVYGGSGEDVLEGDGGDDYLDGGAGSANEAVFAGASHDYAIAYDAALGRWTVTGIAGAGLADGSDTLVNIQRVKFADGLFTLTPAGIQPYAPDAGGAANAPGSVVLSGASVVGRTLDAIVLDGDGVPADPAAITFHWLTSADGGATWTDTGATGRSYKLGEADAGHRIKAEATYVDGHGHAEAPSSAPVTVATATGDVTIALMQLDAPAGASVRNPLTTLLADAIALGFSPNEASLAIKSALGLPDVALNSFDPYAALVANPADPVALAAMKIAAEVAMTASVSDPSGFNLTLALMKAAAAGQRLDLADPATLATLLAGVDPQLLGIVEGLNKDMADVASFSGLTLVWNDYCGQADNLKPYIGHVETLSVHVNQAPTGQGPESLAFGSEGNPSLIAAADLLAGFSDPEGEPLSVTALSASGGGTLVDNHDGSWTFVPDAGFSGPVELAFTVSDPQGATTAGTTLLVIAAAAPPPPPADTTPPVPTIAAEGAAVANGDLVFTLGFSEAVTGLAADDFLVSNGTIKSLSGSGAAYSLVVTPAAGFEGQLAVTLKAGAVADAAGNANDQPASASHAVDTRPPELSFTDDQPGTATGPVTYSLAFTEAVTGLSADDFTVTNGSVASLTGSGASYSLVVAPAAGFEGQLLVSLKAGAVVDGAGNANVAAAAAAQPVDSRAPVASFADDHAGTANGPVVYSLAFTEAVTGLAADDFTVTNGSIVSLAGSGASYSLVVAPAAGFEGQLLVALKAGAVVDASGNANSAAAAAAQPVDTLAPVATGFSPADGAVAVPVGATIALSFSEAIARGSGTISIRSGSPTGPVVETFDAASSSRLSVSGSTLTIDPTADLAADTHYFVLLSGGSVVDLAGNAFAGTSAYDFTTAAADNAIVGTAAADVLVGTGGADAIRGLEGNDMLVGGAGDDILQGGPGNDVLIGGAGFDLADYSTSTKAVELDLRQFWPQDSGGAGVDTLIGIEGLVGGAGDDHLTGDRGDNLLVGNAGRDELDGGAGADRLVGGDGNDRLTGGSGADLFVFDTAPDARTNCDRIADFRHGEDKLALSRAVFGGLGEALGALDPAAFWGAPGANAAHDASDRLIYDTRSGALYYDADGTGSAFDPVLMAMLSGHPALDAKDFLVIG